MMIWGAADSAKIHYYYYLPAECWMSPNTAITEQHWSSSDATLLAARSNTRFASRASSALIWKLFKHSSPLYTCMQRPQKTHSISIKLKVISSSVHDPFLEGNVLVQLRELTIRRILASRSWLLQISRDIDVQSLWTSLGFSGLWRTLS